jgi:hypothetical protein
MLLASMHQSTFADIPPKVRLNHSSPRSHCIQRVIDHAIYALRTAPLLGKADLIEPEMPNEVDTLPPNG